MNKPPHPHPPTPPCPLAFYLLERNKSSKKRIHAMGIGYHSAVLANSITTGWVSAPLIYIKS